MLHFKPFGKTFNPEFIKSPFLEKVKIKIVISLVTTSGNIDFDFTEKSQYIIGKHIRNLSSTPVALGLFQRNRRMRTVLLNKNVSLREMCAHNTNSLKKGSGTTDRYLFK